MIHAKDALEYLLSPITPNTFFEKYFERQPLLIERNEANYFQSYLTLADIDHFLANTDLHYPAFRMAKRIDLSEKVYTTERLFVGKTGHPNYIDLNKTYARFYEGASIVLQALHRNHKPIIDLCKSLEYLFNYPIRANVYITPANSQGFTAHYDNHDVLILQIDGTKRWKVFDTPIKLPLPSQAIVNNYGDLLIDKQLKAGDLLYLPRGFPHEPITEDQHSVHITLGIYTITWYDVLTEWVKRAMITIQGDEAIRQGIPVGWLNENALEDPATEKMLEQHLETFVAQLTQHKASLAEAMALDFVQSRSTSARTQLADLLIIQNLTEDTPIFRRQDILYYLKTGDRLSLSFHGKHLLFPLEFAPVLTTILDGDHFRIADLPKIKVGKQTVQDIIQQLIIEGFLTLFSGDKDGSIGM